MYSENQIRAIKYLQREYERSFKQIVSDPEFPPKFLENLGNSLSENYTTYHYNKSLQKKGKPRKASKTPLKEQLVKRSRSLNKRDERVKRNHINYERKLYGYKGGLWRMRFRQELKEPPNDE